MHFFSFPGFFVHFKQTKNRQKEDLEPVKKVFKKILAICNPLPYTIVVQRKIAVVDIYWGIAKR